MLPADVDRPTPRHPGRRLGRSPGLVRRSRPSSSGVPCVRRRGGRRRSSGPASRRSTGRSAGSGRSGSRRRIAGTGWAGPDRGDHRGRRGGRLPDARARGHRRAAGRCTSGSGSRSRPGTGRWRRPVSPDAAASADVRRRSAPFRAEDLDVDRRARPGGDRRGPRPPPAALRGPGRRRASSSATGRIGGFVIRAPWGGGATIAPRVEDALAILHARRVAAGPGQARPLPGSSPRTAPAPTPSRRTAGPRPGGRPDSSAASRWTGSPTTIWGQFNHAMG